MGDAGGLSFVATPDDGGVAEQPARARANALRRTGIRRMGGVCPDHDRRPRSCAQGAPPPAACGHLTLPLPAFPYGGVRTQHSGERAFS